MSKIKNILIINDYNYTQGGASKVAIQTANLLVAKGYNVLFFSYTTNHISELDPRVKDYCLEKYESLKDRNRMRGIIHGLYNRYSKNKLKKLLETLKREETIVHVHGWTKCLSSSIFKVIFKEKFKCVVTLHDYFTACPNGGYFNYKQNKICHLKPLSFECIKTNCDSRNYWLKCYRIVRQFVQNHIVHLNRDLKNVITISRFSERILKKTLSRDVNLFFVQNPIDLDENRTPIKANQNDYFLYVGRVTKEKGVDLFCKAMTELNEKGIVVGDGSELELLKKKYPNVKYVGWKSNQEVRKYIQKSKALVFPSRWYECAPLTPLEAFQYSIPCIVSDCCAARDYINKRNGKVFSNYEELIEIIRSYNQWYKKFEFNMKNHYAEELCKVYERIIRDCEV